jgi:glycosyltransferase involved in cell wall biosynthesis
MASRVVDPDQRSGAATLVRALHEHLSEQHEVRLVAGVWRDPTLLPAGSVAVPFDADQALRSRLKLDARVRVEALRFRPDVVVGYGVEVPPGLAPTIGLLDDPWRAGADWGRMRGVRQAWVRRRIRGLDIPVAPSESCIQRYRDFGVTGARIRVAWPGVDTARYRPDPDTPAIPKDGPIHLLYAARMLPGKGQHVAIEALKGLHPNVRDRLHLDLVGPVRDPAYVAQLRRRAADAPVSFHHDVPDVVPWYRRAHIVLFPTTMEEVFGYSAIDGIACGKPVIHSRFRALEEVLEGVGVAVPAGDVKRLGEAIRALVKDPERAADLGRRGRELALDRYAWPRAFQRYDALIEEAAG